MTAASNQGVDDLGMHRLVGLGGMLFAQKYESLAVGCFRNVVWR